MWPNPQVWKENYNGRYKIMKHFKILVWFDSPQVKWHRKSSTKSIVYELPHEFPSDSKLKILGNSKIWGKTQK